MDGKIRPAINCELAESDKSRLSSPSPKRSRRAFDKRVVSFPIADAGGPRVKGASESTPPADSWSWRKYGQKPIKGSPYPRGYYRCSSSKGCPARKQVERSSVDPTKMVVTYSCEHNHPWPLPKTKAPDPVRETASPPEPDNNSETADRFSDLIVDESALMAMHDGFWLSDVGSAAPTNSDDVLFVPVPSAGDDLTLDECAKSGGAEDDVMFEGLGELPEYSVVFRRSYVERQMAAG